jgi:hypothetical protein
MRTRRTWTPAWLLAAVTTAGGLAFLHGCEGNDEPLQPSFAATTPQTLTILGFGTGASGTVTAPAVGGAPALSCKITNGVAASSGCTQAYAPGTVVVLSAVPDPQTSFASWGGGCTGSAGCQVTMNISRTVKAKFTADVKLTITGGGTGTGSVLSQAELTPAIACTITAAVPGSTGCSAFYKTGLVVTLTATPATGSVFTGWGGGCTGTGTCTVTMTIARTVKANFKKTATFSLTVKGAGSGSGGVNSQTGLTPAINCTIAGGQAAQTGCKADYAGGTVVILTAVPGPENLFVGWVGSCAQTTDPTVCQVTMSIARTITANFNGAGAGAPAATLGKWSQVYPTPIIAVHAAMLPSGLALLWGHTGEPYLWDPASYPANVAAGFTQVPTGTELFCSGHTFLPDGRLFVPGGHDNAKGNTHGVPDVNIFGAGGWSTSPPMAQGRWYPTATTLGDGSIVVTAGTDNFNVNVTVPELWDGTAWHRLTTAVRSFAYYPRLFLAPNGRLFYAGPGGGSLWLNTSGTGSWSTAATPIVPQRNYGAIVMLDGKVLSIGGGGEQADCTTQVTNRTEIIDLHAATPAWREVGAMTYPRRQANATILPTGEVLVTGGTSACGFSNESASVFPAELWDPVTEQWRVLGSMGTRRVYHSTAILLPDARVLSAGGGDNPGSTNQQNMEVFTPPYLYNEDGSLAARPAFTTSATTLTYNGSFAVSTADPASIAKVTLVRLSATTHTFNQSQQFNTLSFSPGTEGLTVNTPANSNLAPPGPYMLFVVNQAGVPSVAQMVSLQ